MLHKFDLSQLQKYHVLTAVQNPNFSRQQCHPHTLQSLDKISSCSFNEIWLNDK